MKRWPKYHITVRHWVKRASVKRFLCAEMCSLSPSAEFSNTGLVPWLQSSSVIFYSSSFMINRSKWIQAPVTWNSCRDELTPPSRSIHILVFFFFFFFPPSPPPPRLNLLCSLFNHPAWAFKSLFLFCITEWCWNGAPLRHHRLQLWDHWCRKSPHFQRPRKILFWQS